MVAFPWRDVRVAGAPGESAVLLHPQWAVAREGEALLHHAAGAHILALGAVQVDLLPPFGDEALDDGAAFTVAIAPAVALALHARGGGDAADDVGRDGGCRLGAALRIHGIGLGLGGAGAFPALSAGADKKEKGEADHTHASPYRGIAGMDKNLPQGDALHGRVRGGPWRRGRRHAKPET